MKNPPSPPKRKRLNVKSITYSDLIENWGSGIPSRYFGVKLYIRCNSKKEVNWEKSPVYFSEELIEMDNVRIL